MKNERLMIEGVEITVPVFKMQVGDSFFVPTYSLIKAERQIRALGHRVKMKFAVKERIELGVLGVRAWRIM